MNTNPDITPEEVRGVLARHQRAAGDETFPCPCTICRMARAVEERDRLRAALEEYACAGSPDALSRAQAQGRLVRPREQWRRLWAHRPRSPQPRPQGRSNAGGRREVRELLRHGLRWRLRRLWRHRTQALASWPGRTEKESSTNRPKGRETSK